MASSKHRFLVFAIGFALGCLLLAYIQQRKHSDRVAAVRFSVPKSLPPWLGKPVYVGDDEHGVDGLIHRIRIISDSGYGRNVRIKETLIVSPEGKRRIIARQVMEADQCLITVRLDVDPNKVKEWIAGLGYVVLANPLPNVYRVQILEAGANDPLKKGMDRMEDHPEWVILIDPVILTQQ